jgi:acyl dehydratase
MELSAFKAPIDQRYFEDYNKGARFEYGPILVEEAEIISFARRFDPQTIHTDPEAAALGPFNGLIASGWHTMGLMMRLIVDHYLSAIASLGSPGVDEVRWLRPVRPNDQLRLRLSVLEANPSRSKPDRGLVVTLIEAINQRDELVASFKAMNLLKRRSPASAPSS